MSRLLHHAARCMPRLSRLVTRMLAWMVTWSLAGLFGTVLSLPLTAQDDTAGDPEAAAEYRSVDPDDLWILTLDTDAGRQVGVPRGEVLIELAPWLAPKNVAQLKILIRSGFYDGLDFYRVIDNFVAQAGDRAGSKPIPAGAGDLVAELEVPEAAIDAEIVEVGDPFAPETLFYRGFAMGGDAATRTRWPLHCPGVVAMARGNDPNSASTEFYIVTGQAARHLDRNLSVVGRVLTGLGTVQGVARNGPGEGDVIKNPRSRTRILSARLAGDLIARTPPAVAVMKSTSDAFQSKLEARRYRDSAFWVNTPPPWLDVCTVQIPLKVSRP